MAQQQEPEPTRLESAAEIIKALEARKARRQQPAPPPAAGTPTTPYFPVVPEPKRERPVQRPPLGLLCIVDDGTQEGEWLRLRGERTVIGRSDGDVLIPHDVQMSGRHAEIVREMTAKGWRWLLRDLGSTNGTFVRIGMTVLRQDNE